MFKVATPESDNASGTLISVYTYDFTDIMDLRSVLDELVALNLVSPEKKPVYWKADAYTYQSIKSNNPYKLKASLYSSRDWSQSELENNLPKAAKASLFGHGFGADACTKSATSAFKF